MEYEFSPKAEPTQTINVGPAYTIWTKGQIERIPELEHCDLYMGVEYPDPDYPEASTTVETWLSMEDALELMAHLGNAIKERQEIIDKHKRELKE